MKTTRNNKGAAMVTVLIAVSFIIILASSLMYMSYMNYLAKAMRYQGTDNFYTDEYALDDLCMTMQQVAADCDSVSEAMDTLLSSTPGKGVGRQTIAGHSCYTNELVAQLISVASKEATISVNTVYDTSVSGNLIVDTSSIQLLGLEITSTTDSGYQSTICTDVMLTFPNGGLGDLDVNDFSVIGDSPIQVDEGDVFFSGCVYIDGRGGTALTVNSAGNVHILSPRGIINGDIVINGTGQLSITGIVTVNGDIYVNDSAVLLCSEDLKHTGAIHKASNARVLGVDSSTFGEDDSINVSSLPTNGLGEKLLTPIFARDNGDFYEMSLDDFQDAGGHLKYEVQEQDGRPKVNVMIGMQNPENRNENSLVLSTRDVTIKGEFVNSTIVCGGTIIFSERSMPTYMQSMSDEAFEAAKMGVMGSGGGTSGRGGFGFTPIAGGSHGNYNFAGCKYSDIPDYDDSGVDDHVYTAPGGEIRHFVYYSGSNYVPFGYFLADNTSQTITDIFKGVQGNADPVDTNIYVTNWIKE